MKKLLLLLFSILLSFNSFGEWSKVTEDNDGNMVVIARYPDESTMEAATATAQDAFGEMITQGAADGSSIDQWHGEVVMSF